MFEPRQVVLFGDTPEVGPEGGARTFGPTLEAGKDSYFSSGIVVP